MLTPHIETQPYGRRKGEKTAQKAEMLFVLSFFMSKKIAYLHFLLLPGYCPV